MKKAFLGNNLLASLGLSAALGMAVTSSVIADEPKRGRLPDGTAFRTDVKGSEIVDYVAELEVNVEELLRRIHGLEDELEEAKKGGAPAAPVVERDLSTGAPAVSASTQNLLECRKTLEACEGERASLKSAVSTTVASGDSASEELRSTLALKDQDIEGRDREIAALKQEITALRTKVVSEEREIAQQQSADAAKAVEASRYRAATIVDPQPAPVSAEAVASDSDRASVDISQAQAVQAQKGKLRTEFNRLQSALSTRDSLYQRFVDGRGGAVQFHPVEVSKAELVGLKRTVESGSSQEALSKTGARISELRRLLEADIGLMKRLLAAR